MPEKTKPAHVLKHEYGRFLEFRGLQHAPVNAEGVVYAFALLAKELGFTVEAIGTVFPRYEARRQMDIEGERWQRVRMEFGYFSSEFQKHKQLHEKCDIIVCWKDDWPECPLEVIELPEEIKRWGAKDYERALS